MFCVVIGERTGAQKRFSFEARIDFQMCEGGQKCAQVRRLAPQDAFALYRRRERVGKQAGRRAYAQDDIMAKLPSSSYVSAGTLRRGISAPHAHYFPYVRKQRAARVRSGVEQTDDVFAVAFVEVGVGVGHLFDGVADEVGDDGEVCALVDEQRHIGMPKVVQSYAARARDLD